MVRTVGRFEIVRELGRGGMAIVYLARQTDLDRSVALKELGALRQSDRAFTRRFLRESRLAGSLSHPNIVTVYDYFESDGVPYIAMEYVEGGSLRPHIGHMALTQVAGVLEGILSGLDHAERRGVVNRDLKPENVLVTSDGRVKITDFGIAKATGAVQTRSVLTTNGMTVGTPSYMAPEQAMGQDVGPWTDLYSVGVMAFELFVGHVPFHDTEEPLAILMRQVSDPIPPARSLNPEIDEAISDWIERLLEKEPADRFQSAAEAWDELEHVVIDLVGPRWRRSARLVEPSMRPQGMPAGPATPPPTRAPRPPLMTLGVPDRGPEAPTRRLDPRQRAERAATVMPEAATRRLAEDESGPPPSATRRRGRSGAARLAKGALLLLGVLAVLAATLGGRDSKPAGSNVARTAPAPAPVPTSSLAGPDLELRVPRGWSRLATAPDLGLALSGATAAAPRDRQDGPALTFGFVKGSAASNSALLAPGFLESIGKAADAPPARSAIRLPAQGLQAWRYRNLRPVGTGDQLTVYAVPTSNGVATVACAAPPEKGTEFARQCDALAATLRLRTATAYPIGPSEAYAGALNDAIGDVQQASDSAQANLERSDTLAGQAAITRALASSYDAAARQLAALDLSPADRQANGRLVSALRAVARAYRTAASAARAGDAGAYRAASAALPGVKAKLNTALAGVRAAGYKPTTAAQPADGQTAPTTRPPATGQTAPPAAKPRTPAKPAQPQSDVGDSRSDDPSDDLED